jgi:hypothetical protein
MQPLTPMPHKNKVYGLGREAIIMAFSFLTISNEEQTKYLKAD